MRPASTPTRYGAASLRRTAVTLGPRWRWVSSPDRLLPQRPDLRPVRSEAEQLAPQADQLAAVRAHVVTVGEVSRILPRRELLHGHAISLTRRIEGGVQIAPIGWTHVTGALRGSHRAVLARNLVGGFRHDMAEHETGIGS